MPDCFRLGIEAHRLGLAYEYDPFFSLSIARVDPLPHQLEAVYDYFLQAAAHPVPPGRRPGRRQDDHGRAAPQGAQGPRPGPPTSDRHAGQPDLPVAARTEGQVPRAVRGHRGGRAARQLRPEPVAGTRPGHHLGLLGLARRRRPREPAAAPDWDLVIVDEAHKMRALREDQKTLRLPLWRVALEDDRPLPADDGHAAQGRPRATFCLFLACSTPMSTAASRASQEAMRRTKAPFYLRRTKEALVTFPDPKPARSTSCSRSARSARPPSISTARNSISTTS